MIYVLPFAKDLCSPERTFINLKIDKSYAMYRCLFNGNISGWEYEVLCTLLTLASITKKKEFLDIGSNIGFYSLCIKSLFSNSIECFSVEPNPNLYKKIRENAEINKLNINYINLAISSEHSDLDFYITQDDSCSSLEKPIKNIKEVIKVKTCALDTLYKKASFDIIKIDTEGTEFDVIKSGRESIIQNKPYILIEILNGHNFTKLQGLIRDLNYFTYKITKNFSLEYCKEYSKPARKSENNYLLSPHQLTPYFFNIFEQWKKAIIDTYEIESPEIEKIKSQYIKTYEYIKFKFIDYIDFIFFPITGKSWCAIYNSQMSKLIHYEFDIIKNKIYFHLHFETQNTNYNIEMMDLLYEHFNKRKIIFNKTIQKDIRKNKNIYGIFFYEQYVDDFAWFNLYSELMKEFILKTFPFIISVKNYK